MKIYSYALTAVALALCQVCAAQGLEPVLAASPPPASADPSTSASANANDEPRIIRGNDQVIAPAKPSPWLDSAPVTLNFEEAPIAEVVRTILGDILKTSYVLHPPLAGTVTLSTRAPVSPDQAVFLLESALYANGLALVRDARGSYHVGRPDALKGAGSSVRQAGKVPLQPGSGVIVVPLQYIGAAEMASILRPLLPPDGLVRVDTVRNLLVLTGTRTQAESWQDLIDTFDIDLLKGMSVGVFPLKYASIKEVEGALQLMSAGAGAGAGAAAAPAAGGARPPAGGAAAATAMLGEGNPLFGAMRIMPIEQVQDSQRELPTPQALWRRRALGRREVRVDWVNAACLVLPQSVWQSVGGFDESYFMYCEDVDLCLRVRLAGLALVQAPVQIEHSGQRASHQRWAHLRWHLSSLLRLWRSPVYRQARLLCSDVAQRTGVMGASS